MYVFFFIDFKLGCKTVSFLFDLFLFIDFFFLLGVRSFSVGEGFAMQTWGPEFEPSALTPEAEHCSTYLQFWSGRQSQEDPSPGLAVMLNKGTTGSMGDLFSKTKVVYG